MGIYSTVGLWLALRAGFEKYAKLCGPPITKNKFPQSSEL
jgi:hypothetical protein